MYRMLWHARGRGPRGGSGMGSGARGRMAACRLECISQTIAHTVSETFTPNPACPTFGFRVLTVNSHFRTCLHTPSCLIATRNTRNTRNARNKRTAGGSAHVTTNTGVSKGSAAESGRMGGLKVARGEPGPRGAVVVAARGAVWGVAHRRRRRIGQGRRRWWGVPAPVPVSLFCPGSSSPRSIHVNEAPRRP